MSVTFRALSELCDRNISLIDPKREPEHEFWYIDISAVDNKTKRITTPQRVMGKAASVRARQVVKKNDVLVATTRPNLNAVALVPESYDKQVCSTGFSLLRAGDELDPEYLFAYVQSELFIRPLVELVQGALYPAVTDKQVFAQSIPWVPLHEQRRIAAHLKAQLAAVAEARNAALAQQRLSNQLQAKILAACFAELDGEMLAVGDFMEVVRGSSPRPQGDKRFFGGTVPRLMVEDVTRDGMYVVPKVDSLTEEGAKRSRPMKAGSLVMVVSGAPGVPAILGIDACIHDGFIGFPWFDRSKAETEFLYYWFLYRRFDTDRHATGAIFRNLTTDQVKMMGVLLPPPAEQGRIATKLKEQLSEVAVLQKSIAAKLQEIELLPARLLAAAFNETEYA